MNSFVNIILTFFIASIFCGCLRFSFPESTVHDNASKQEVETVLVANRDNVYRLATNAVLDVMVQKDGKWVKSEHRVLIPEGWFMVSGDGL